MRYRMSLQRRFHRKRFPDDLVSVIASLPLLDDEPLQRAARHNLLASIATRIEDVHTQRQRYGLPPTQREELQRYVHQYETHILVRAGVAALVHKRGHAVALGVD